MPCPADPVTPHRLLPRGSLASRPPVILCSVLSRGAWLPLLSSQPLGKFTHPCPATLSQPLPLLSAILAAAARSFCSPRRGAPSWQLPALLSRNSPGSPAEVTGAQSHFLSLQAPQCLPGVLSYSLVGSEEDAAALSSLTHP